MQVHCLILGLVVDYADYLDFTDFLRYAYDYKKQVNCWAKFLPSSPKGCFGTSSIFHLLLVTKPWQCQLIFNDYNSKCHNKSDDHNFGNIGLKVKIQ